MPNQFTAKIPPEERFWSHVNKANAKGCWPWTASMTTSGYGGWKNHPHGRFGHAHRWAYYFTHGTIPEGLVIDHLCRNRACCNPSHLQAVTTRVNLLKGETRAATNAAKTTCIRGHNFDLIYKNRGGYTRACSQCRAINAEMRAKKAREN